MVQGINREYIFHTNHLKEYYKELLIKKLSEYHSIIISYCIMDNHAHFLFYSESEKEISKIFQRVNGAYSNYYNKIKKRVGYVFRDRFLSQEIQDINRLVNCMKYIHNNPVKAKMVNCPEEYFFSSYQEYMHEVSSIIDFHLASIILNQIKNKEVIFEKDSSEEDGFLDISNFDSNFFYNDYFPKLNIMELKKNRKLLKEEVIKCRIKMEVPVKELANAFNIPLKTIYNWLNHH